MNKEEILKQALSEIQQEVFRREVEIEKERQRLRRPWWKKICPWKITIKIERK